MELPFDPGPRPPGVDALLGEIPAALLDERSWYATELGERYATELALEAIEALDLESELIQGGSAAELLVRRGFAADFLPALASLLARLAAVGELEAAGEPPVYRSPKTLRASDRCELRRMAIAQDAALEAALALLDAAGESYPAIASGRTTGELTLLQPSRVGLWLGYFSNANPVYALSNRIAALVAANRLPAPPSRSPLRILEIGAGAGSAAEALLGELERRGRLGEIETYTLTEPSPFFRRRAERELGARFPTVPLEARALDIDLPFAEQGIASEFDLIYGVNVIHVAHRLDESLARLHAALRPGGALVAGECFRLFPGQPIPADLVFQLVRGFTSVETDPVLRPHHGFLEPAVWRRALAAGGFEAIEIVPELERIRDLYPRFFAGALCGRRPVESLRSETP